MTQTLEAIPVDEYENGLMTLENIPTPALNAAAEVDVQISTARRFPRSLKAFKQQALEMATFDEETASGCFYALPRGKKPVEGPSVRLAEIILSAWGNIRSEARVIAADAKEITAEAMTWDLEKNVAIRVQVKRRITDKYGKRYSDDMVTVTGNAACSIALRNSVFRVIPMVYTKAICQAARQVAIGDIKTLAAKRDEMISYFGKMGITPDRIFEVIGKMGVEDIGLDELALLKGLATAIKEGDITVDEAFAVTQTSSEAPAVGVQSVAEKLQKKQAEASEPAPTEPSPVEAEPVEADPLEALRANAQAAYDELPKRTQADVMAGKPVIGKMTEEELTNLLAEIEKVRD